MSKWVDLTQTVTERLPTLQPLHPKPEFEDFATLDDDGYNSTLLTLETHCGTHLDAPTHFFPTSDHRTVDEFTVDEMVAEGVICDFSDAEPGTAITRTELEAAAESFDLRKGDYLFLDCGMTPRDDSTYLENYVYPEKAAAEYMVEKEITCLATDALSADRPGAPLNDERVHFTLLPEDIWIIEGVANLSNVSSGRYDVICTPIPYEGRDGSQVRLLVRPQD